MRMTGILLIGFLFLGGPAWAVSNEAEGPYQQQLSKFPQFYADQAKEQREEMQAQQKKNEDLTVMEMRLEKEQKRLEESITVKRSAIETLTEENQSLRNQVAALQEEYTELQTAVKEQKARNELLKNEIKAGEKNAAEIEMDAE